MSAEFDNFTRSWNRQRDQLEFSVGRRAAVAVVLLLLLVAGVLIAVAVAGLMLVAGCWRQTWQGLFGAPPRYNRFIKFKETRTQ